LGEGGDLGVQAFAGLGKAVSQRAGQCRHPACQTPRALHRCAAAPALQLALGVFIDQVPFGILVEHVQAQPLDQGRDARLAGPEPCRPHVEGRALVMHCLDAVPKPRPGLDEQKIAGLAVQHVGKCQTAQAAADDQGCHGRA